MERLPVPPVIHRPPECPLCAGDLHFEDGWICDPCQVFWPDTYDDPGSSEEFEPRPQCEEVIEPYGESEHASIRSYRFRCVREQGHDIDPSKPWRALEHVGIRVDGEKPNPRIVHEWATRR